MRSLHKFLLITLLLFVLQSCDLVPLKPGVWKNEKIASNKQKDLHELNDKLIKALESKDQEAVEGMLSGEMMKGQYKRQVELAMNQVKQGGYALNTEYYIVNQLKHGEYIKPRTDTTDVDYGAIAKEMYIACFLPKTGDNKYMVTAIYGKFDYGWKIDQLEIAPYTVNGKTGFELYQQAKQQLGKNYIVPAYNTMQLALTAARPCDEVKNPNETQMARFNGQLMEAAAANFKMPIVLDYVSSRPLVIKVFNQRIDQGTYPTIYYISKYDVRDTIALKKEHEEVKRNIAKSIPGIDKDTRYLLYSVYNKDAKGGRSSYYYNITDKLQ